MFGWHVSEVDHNTNGMRMNLEQRLAISICVMTFRADFKRERFAPGFTSLGGK